MGTSWLKCTCCDRGKSLLLFRHRPVDGSPGRNRAARPDPISARVATGHGDGGSRRPGARACDALRSIFWRQWPYGQGSASTTANCTKRYSS